jgi:hypothetical protein
MTELTPRQILDAIRRGLEETARHFGNGRLDQAQRPQPGEAARDATERNSQTTAKRTAS